MGERQLDIQDSIEAAAAVVGRQYFGGLTTVLERLWGFLWAPPATGLGTDLLNPLST